MKNRLYSYFLIPSLFIMFTGCLCDYKIVNCPPDQRPVNFPKNQKCAKVFYEDAVKSLNITAGATVDIIGEVTVGANAGIRNDAISLAEKLNNETIRLREKLQASFITFSIDPCGTKEEHFRLMQAINDKDNELQRVKASFNNIKNNDSLLKQAVNYDYLRGLEDGKNMFELCKSLETYYTNNQKFPKQLSDLNKMNLINKLSMSRLKYDYTSDSLVTLTFAGEDYALNTIDDKIYEGIKGKMEFIEKP